MLPVYPALSLRNFLSQMVDADHQTREQYCIRIVEQYSSQTQHLLYQLLSDIDLHVRQQAALALGMINAWAVGNAYAPSSCGLYITCLGPLHIYSGQRKIRFQDLAMLQSGRAGWLKVLGVFFYLIHCGRAGIARAEIGHAVWGKQVSPNSIARTLSTLRQTLIEAFSPAFVEQILTITAEHCTLSPEVYLTDAQIFERVCVVAFDTEEQEGIETAIPFYTLAVQRYTGDYLEMIPYADETCLEQRHHLLSNYIMINERLAEQAYTQQRYRHCILLCQHALEVEPVSEELTLWLLRSCDVLRMRGELEHAYCTYLRETEILPHSAEGQADSVVQFYQHLHQV